MELSTKFKKGTVSDLIRICKTLKQIKNEEGFLIFPCMNKIDNCKIYVYTDAALANLNDGCSSMGAHLVLLVDPDGKCCVLNWQANKIKRFVRSSLAAETLSLEEGVEDAVFLRILIEEILGIPQNTIV